MRQTKTAQQEKAVRLDNGDKVEWHTSQGKTHGKVVRTVKSDIKVKGHRAKASQEKPQVLVESAKSGKRAVHKPGALRKIS